MDLRLVQLPLLLENVPEVIGCLGQIRPEADGLP